MQGFEKVVMVLGQAFFTVSLAITSYIMTWEESSVLSVVTGHEFVTGCCNQCSQSPKINTSPEDFLAPPFVPPAAHQILSLPSP